MRAANHRMLDFADRNKCGYRLACYGVALERLLTVYKERGIFP